MLHFLAWYLLVTLLGWMAFPLAWRLFPALSDRGFAMVRAVGLLVWGFLFWALVSLGVIHNDSGGLLGTLLLVAGLSLWAGWKNLFTQPAPMLGWMRSNRRMIILVEVLFLTAFAVWAFIRASNPDIETAGGEKTMELAFINAILRSPAFPPHDPWLSGFSISYYYFGYVMTAMLAKFTATPAPVAHNLMLALVFALSFCGAYGVLYDLLGAWRVAHPRGDHPAPRRGLALLGPLFLLFVSNVAGFLEVLHRRGIGWSGQPGDTNLWTKLGTLAHADLQAYNFWTWLDILHLNVAPLQPAQWTPDRFIWWWQDSRVVQDYNLSGIFNEVIDEFPAFSYMLGDLHPHVLAMPFDLLVIAFALNLFLEGVRETNLRFYRLPVSPLHLASGALLLGGLAFLNTWDILSGFSLLVGAYVLGRVHSAGWKWERLKELFAFGLPLGLAAILLYIPFYVSFSSQAGGILPNLEFVTRGAHLWVMFGTLFVPLLAYLLHLWRVRSQPVMWKMGLVLGLGFVALLWVFSLGLGLLAQTKLPDFVAGYLGSQGFTSAALYIGAASLRRLYFLGSLLTLLALFIPTLAFLAAIRPAIQAEPADLPEADPGLPDGADQVSRPHIQPHVFVLLMIFLGTVLVLAPEFVYLRDLFGTRVNTIFKFYYQAWLLWSLAAAFGTAVLLQELRRGWQWAWRLGLGIVLIVGLTFPVFALADKTHDFMLPAFNAALKAARASADPNPLQTAASVWSLDGAAWFHEVLPDDAAAADWLLTAPPGVIAEAVGGSYSGFARMSAYSGDTAVVGWIGHEDQWRGTFDEQRQHGEIDIPFLYQTNSWDEALAIIREYDIRYVVVGTLERSTYRVNELSFQQYLVPVFQSGDVVIYEVP